MAAAPKPTLYERLGVDLQAADDAIRAAYIRLAKEWHPDRNRGGDSGAAQRRFQDIQEAYETLMDSERRSAYDMQLLHLLDAEEYVTRFHELVLTVNGLGMAPSRCKVQRQQEQQRQWQWQQQQEEEEQQQGEQLPRQEHVQVSVQQNPQQQGQQRQPPPLTGVPQRQQQQLEAQEQAQLLLQQQQQQPQGQLEERWTGQWCHQGHDHLGRKEPQNEGQRPEQKHVGPQSHHQSG